MASVKKKRLSFKNEGKSKEIVETVMNGVAYLMDEGAEAIILGCTELPLIVDGQQSKIPLIDPNELLAKAVVAYCKQ